MCFVFEFGGHQIESISAVLIETWISFTVWNPKSESREAMLHTT